jgi:hypothetical protein
VSALKAPISFCVGRILSLYFVGNYSVVLPTPPNLSTSDEFAMIFGG